MKEEVRTARLRVSVLVGLAITLMVAFVGGIAYAVMVHAQETQVTRELQYNARFGVPSVAPKCAWVFVLKDGVVDVGPLEVPAGFPLRADLTAVGSSGVAISRDVSANGTSYMVLTTPGAAGAVQAVFDLRYQLADRAHLLQALGIALLAGLLLAAFIGLSVGRRTVGPLAEALARQRRFVADASHELRTPIARAYLRAQLLQTATDLPDGHRDNLDALARSIRGLGDVVDDLLLSAQLSGQPGQPVDLTAVADAAVKGESVRAVERGIVLSVEHAGIPLVVNGIETALRRSVDELLANAVRHTPEGGRISVRLRAVGGFVELVVADTGEGFDQREADGLFERYRHGAGENRFGLGLSLVREIVTGHGGTVEAVGHPGRGARFTLRLPLAGQRQNPVPLRERITAACP
ncbi:HAMP domain-containing sensor histidine kinase [Lentzea sp. NPDC006480]|uniref:sensor histidine kinase n=1 Tax=Lentzea sp. NPDC006480 TaxID=3157176 RepID=UPI0033A707D1